MQKRTLFIIIGGVVGLVILVCLGCLAVSLIGRAVGATPTAQVVARVTEVAGPSSTPIPANTRPPTSTPAPSNTPAPTRTPLPTQTPTVSPTATPLPKPIKLSGSGDSVVDVDKGDWPAIATIKYTGGSNFSIWTYGEDGKENDLLVNTIGAYQGVRLIDAAEGEATTRLQIKSSGNWEIEIAHVTQARRVKVPGTVSGNGDDVVILDGKPDVGKVDASKAKSNFVVWAYSASDADLAVNKIAPYTGTIILSDALMLDIKATGPWSIEVTAK